MRWVLVHMIEKYARHDGHDDLLREAVDGLDGRVTAARPMLDHREGSTARECCGSFTERPNPPSGPAPSGQGAHEKDSKCPGVVG